MTGPILIIDVEPDAESTQAPVKRGSPADILARTLYGEARGESVRGIEAVAAVVMNRVRRGGWWGNTVETVCRKRWQFSCWNEADPNRAKLERVDENDRVFRICVRIARRAIAGSLDDPTGGATHYHTRAVMPAWARSLVPCAEIGAHLFYNNVE
jgi:Cell wall hydrolyses involved in spore germination